MNARARARRGEGERLREEILEAATGLLVDTGDEQAVTIRAVATAVGVSPPSIYLHFADKEHLLYEVCQHTFGALDDHIEAAVAGVDDPLEELRLRGQAYVRFGLENPEHYRILFMTRMADKAHVHSTDEIVGAAAFEHHVAAVQRCADAGLFAEGADVLLVAIGLWAAVHGVTSLLVALPQFPWPPVEQLVDHMLTTQVKGLVVDA
jgi:AcrR family transcriptional regulator